MVDTINRDKSWISSGGESAHGSKWLVSSLEAKCLFNLVVKELSVLGNISITLDSFSAGGLDHLNAIVASVAASDALQGA